ncbi:hypothetical protein AWC32_22690 [Mycobacterium xenopi]|nr:hypothetical protein AWC32_22690 [Mycobacterium xenopi]
MAVVPGRGTGLWITSYAAAVLEDALDFSVELFFSLAVDSLELFSPEPLVELFADSRLSVR